MRKKPEPGAEAAASAPTFEEKLESLEAMVERLEAPDLPLEEALAMFEKGMLLSAECRKTLTEAEARVEMLLEKDGAMEAAPFELEEEE